MKIILSILLFMLLLSCNKEEQVEIDVTLNNSFSILTIDSRFDVILTQGSEESMRISGHPKLVNKVSHEITGDELHISSKSKSAWLRPKNNRVTIHLTVKELKRININETGSLVCTNALTGNEIGVVTTGKLAIAELKLNCTTFYFWNNFPCSGKITLEGEVNKLKLWNHALMQIDALKLNAIDSELENNSKGDILTTTISSIKYSINGEGNIQLKGNPPVITPLSSKGSGQLIEL